MERCCMRENMREGGKKGIITERRHASGNPSDRMADVKSIYTRCH